MSNIVIVLAILAVSAIFASAVMRFVPGMMIPPPPADPEERRRHALMLLKMHPPVAGFGMPLWTDVKAWLDKIAELEALRPERITNDHS